MVLGRNCALFLRAQKFFVLVMSLLLVSQSALANKCCYCEIGQYPENQQGFFKMGCNIWLAAQKNCDVKEIVPQNTNYSEGDLQCKGGDLVVGYVGHWGSSYETVRYLANRIVPAMQKHGVSVEVDNTACLAMSQPHTVLDYVKGLGLPENQSLSVSGNQVLSIGKWDAVLGDSVNFGAKVSSTQSAVMYPLCKRFRGYNCIGQIQLQNFGTCMEEDGQLKKLGCCAVPGSPQPDGMNVPTTNYIWTEGESCK